ncbi:phage portal protein [Paroceanicella profunda]|uniref:Phage portal protein n=1 Tax=Paroceanicella profunda TaxID=2579971 RepID=A0A5B8FG64_9RHOB|nr:phage portal protein [Paroceanicella profunda]QDL90468.1 phage portal protein [Paroceanicella profunda]
MLSRLFKRSARPIEKRAAGTGYTAQVIAARESYISGAGAVAELTATAQACVSLWEGCFALADVQGTDLLDRHTMALLARSAALRGEAVLLITERGLAPCVDWDLSTRHGIPRAYRLSVSEAGGARSFTALADEVLHLRIGSDTAAPWTGTAPLRRAQITAELLHQVETALRDVYRDAPLGSQIVHAPDGEPEDIDQLRRSIRGNRGGTLLFEGVAQATAAGMHPNLGKSPDQLSPDLSKSMAIETLGAARDAVAMAFGVLPGLLNRATTGPLVREAQRHLAGWTLQPVAMLLAEEATRKLGTEIMIDTLRPVQAYDVGGRARALSTIIKALAEAKEAGIDPASLNEAQTLVNWGEGDKAV